MLSDLKGGREGHIVSGLDILAVRCSPPEIAGNQFDSPKPQGIIEGVRELIHDTLDGMRQGIDSG